MRRDNCVMVRKLIGSVLDDLLKHRDLDKAIAHVKAVISDLLMNRIDMSDLVVSKNLSQASPHSMPIAPCPHSEMLPCLSRCDARVS